MKFKEFYEDLQLKQASVFKSPGFSVILDAFDNAFAHTGNKRANLCLLQALIDCIHIQTPVKINRATIEKMSFDKQDMGTLVKTFAKGIKAKDNKKYGFNFSFYECKNIKELKMQIDNGFPVLVLIQWMAEFSDMFVDHDENGILRYPKDDSDLVNDYSKRSYHAMIAVGYDNQQRVIICKNQEKRNALRGYIKIDEKFFFNEKLKKARTDAIKMCMLVKIDSYDEI